MEKLPLTPRLSGASQSGETPRGGRDKIDGLVKLLKGQNINVSREDAVAFLKDKGAAIKGKNAETVAVRYGRWQRTRQHVGDAPSHLELASRSVQIPSPSDVESPAQTPRGSQQPTKEELDLLQRALADLGTPHPTTDREGLVEFSRLLTRNNIKLHQSATIAEKYAKWLAGRQLGESVSRPSRSLRPERHDRAQRQSLVLKTVGSADASMAHKISGLRLVMRTAHHFNRAPDAYVEEFVKYLEGQIGKLGVEAVDAESLGAIHMAFRNELWEQGHPALACCLTVDEIENEFGKNPKEFVRKINAAWFGDENALMHAARAGDRKLIGALIEMGADPAAVRVLDTRNYLGWPKPLRPQDQSRMSRLIQAADDPTNQARLFHDFASNMLAANTQPGQPFITGSRQPFHNALTFAIKNCDPEIVEAICLSAKDQKSSVINDVDGEGHLPIVYALELQKGPVVLALLENGADLDKKNQRDGVGARSAVDVLRDGGKPESEIDEMRRAMKLQKPKKKTLAKLRNTFSPGTKNRPGPSGAVKKERIVFDQLLESMESLISTIPPINREFIKAIEECLPNKIKWKLVFRRPAPKENFVEEKLTKLLVITYAIVRQVHVRTLNLRLIRVSRQAISGAYKSCEDFRTLLSIAGICYKHSKMLTWPNDTDQLSDPWDAPYGIVGKVVGAFKTFVSYENGSFRHFNDDDPAMADLCVNLAKAVAWIAVIAKRKSSAYPYCASCLTIAAQHFSPELFAMLETKLREEISFDQAHESKFFARAIGKSAKELKKLPPGPACDCFVGLMTNAVAAVPRKTDVLKSVKANLLTCFKALSPDAKVLLRTALTEDEMKKINEVFGKSFVEGILSAEEPAIDKAFYDQLIAAMSTPGESRDDVGIRLSALLTQALGPGERSAEGRDAKIRAFIAAISIDPKEVFGKDESVSDVAIMRGVVEVLETDKVYLLLSWVPSDSSLGKELIRTLTAERD